MYKYLVVFAIVAACIFACDPSGDCTLVDGFARCFPGDDPLPDPNDGTCGGLSGLGCENGFYCQYEAYSLCGADDGLGECLLIPDICTEVYDPVCGCDDVTYDNACNAAIESISVAYTGECTDAPPPPDGAPCGGNGGISCGGGYYCHYEPEARCGAADEQGECRRVDKACGGAERSICGCDDTTYPSACEAASAGVSVAYDRACECTSDDCEAPREGYCPPVCTNVATNGPRQCELVPRPCPPPPKKW
ncbi:MAG: Kazal-type serine protease inhibitor family protein [Myxococcales bacterium]|nr:Kazal-type serine protease inhibitor family protein [Myxococcales bacterium]